MARHRSPAHIARRSTAWAVAFTALAALHLLVLPQLLEERFDVVVAVGAGLVYLGLAAWNWHIARATPA